MVNWQVKSIYNNNIEKKNLLSVMISLEANNLHNSNHKFID